jgi:hypothetical protein
MNRYAMSVAVLAVTGSVCAQAVQWTEAEGGNGHWYALTHLSDPLWSEARSHAQALGGDLAVVDSVEANFWLSQCGMVAEGNTRVWIGLWQNPESDAWAEPAGGWEWVNGNPVGWTNWGSNEPNDSNGYEEQAVTYGIAGHWNDSHCQWPSACPDNSLVEWSADCTGDGIVDYGQIIDGTFDDANGNGVPDCCDDDEPCFSCPGDIVGNDGVVGVDDLLFVIAAYWQINVPADLDGDGVVDEHDILLILEYWGVCP